MAENRIITDKKGRKTHDNKPTAQKHEWNKYKKEGFTECDRN